MTGKNKIKKLISGLLIILILLPAILFSFPRKGDAWMGIGDTSINSNPIGDFFSSLTSGSSSSTAITNAGSLGIQVKNVAIEVGKQLLKAAAKRVLAEMTKATINWINSDFHGAPLFLENPDSFFNDIAKTELKNIVNTFGYDSLTYPFGKQFALNAIASYKSQLDDNAGYTLSKVMSSAELVRYRNDFNYGGWNGFLINTQYPQNNVVGFNMIATEELARRIQGTVQNAAEKVQTSLQQGMGFLSPQKCIGSNADEYNNGANEFQKPSFQYEQMNCEGYEFSPDELRECEESWTAKKNAAKIEWEKKNTCQGKLVTTTPGSVAGNQVMKAMGASWDQTVMDGAMGNSLSAIFDALINHFLDKGLNSLSSKVNPKPVTDDWSYDGQTLGSSAANGNNSTWGSGPDQPIDLNDFKKTIDKGIESTSTEIKLMYNDAPDKPGIYQMYDKIWPKAQELDKCIPGPDIIKFKERINEEFLKMKNTIEDKTSDGILGGDQDLGDSVSKELDSTVKFFKDWIDNKTISELPSSLIYIDSVNNLTTLSEEMNNLINNRTTRSHALVRLQAIKTSLDTISTQPDPGSAEDKVLVSLWKQYQGASADFSNTNTIENTRNKLSEAKDIYNDLVKSMDPTNPLGCPAQRIAKGWSWSAIDHGGPSSKFNNDKTEMQLFCSLPIVGGYSHKHFLNTGEITHPDIPLVNAKNVLTYQTVTMMSLFQAANGGNFEADDPVSLKDPRVERTLSINLNCNNIFNASSVDYKGDLPSLPKTTTTTQSNP